MTTAWRAAAGIAGLIVALCVWYAPNAAADTACREQRVVMLMTTWCPYCRKATAFFKEHGIKVQEIDIEKTENERIRTLRPRAAVPTILVGDTIIEGFSETRLRQLLCIE